MTTVPRHQGRTYMFVFSCPARLGHWIHRRLRVRLHPQELLEVRGRREQMGITGAYDTQQKRTALALKESMS
jgi:hypothetical protein